MSPSSHFGQLPGDKSAQQKNDKKPRERKDKRKKPKSKLQLPVFRPTEFVSKRPASSNDLAILKPLPMPLTSVSFRPSDPWDVENQAKMKEIELEYRQNRISLQTAYDILAPMRKTERAEMEKRGLVDSTERRKDLSEATEFLGSCEEMCPVFERVRRAHENMLLSLERDSEGRADQSLAIKAFSRPAAGQPPPLPSDVRPPRVLVATLHYLVTELVPRLPHSHSLIWDRTRSIRQDFTYQNYQGPEAIYCFEIIARVHCHSLHVMAKSVQKDGSEWSQQQELEQFNKCLQSLLEFYAVTPSPNQPEMCSYLLMSHMDDAELVASIDRMPIQVSRHPLVNLAIELRSLASVCVPQFFSRLRQPDVPATLRAIAEVHFNRIRVQMVRKLASAVHRQISMYSLKRFAALLAFETLEEARRFCEFFDVNVLTSEEGEEIDLKTWSEANIRDKQQPNMAFDESLDLPMKQQDLLLPVSPVPVDQQVMDQGASGNSFVPQDNREKSQSEAAHSAVSAEERLKQIKAKEEVLREQKKRQQQKEQQKQEQERQEQERKRQEQQEFERKREEERKRNEEEESRRELAAKKQRLLEEQRLKKQETERRQQEQHHAELVTMRTGFVQNLTHKILGDLVQTFPAKDLEGILKSLDLSRRLLLSRICRKVGLVANASLKSKHQAQARAEELALFRSKRQRAVSQRKDTSLPRSLQGTPSEMSLVQADNYSTESVVESHDIIPVPLLAELLAPAVSAGLRELTVSSHGIWLPKAMHLGESIEVYPDEFCAITSNFHDAAVVISDYDNVPGAYAERVYRGKSIADLKVILKDLLDEYVRLKQSELSSLRSLSFKRRRVSSVRETNPRPSIRSAPNPLSSTEERLRQAIANAKKLVNDV